MSWVYRRPSDPRQRRRLVPPATRGVQDQTIDGVLFTRAPTFPTGQVDLQLNGVLFAQAPTFPTGSVNLQVNGVTFTRAPTFPAGQINLQLNGILFAQAPTFPTGAVNAQPVTLTGVLFTRAPTFPAGSLSAVLAGVLFTKAPTFPTGAVNAQPVTLTGVLFTRAPTFPTGQINLRLNGVLFTRAPTFATGQIDLRLNGVVFTRAPTFATGLVNLRILGAVFAQAPTFPTGDVSLATGDQTITGVLFPRAPTFPIGAVQAQPVTLTGVLFTRAPTFATGQVDLRLNGVLFSKAGTFPTGAINAQPVTINGVLFTLAPTFPTGTTTLTGTFFWQPDPVTLDLTGPSLILPGLSGHFADTPDINLLDADTAHAQQSLGLHTQTSQVVNTQIATPSVVPPFGTTAVRFETLITGTVFVRIPVSAGPLDPNAPVVAPNSLYTMEVWAFTEASGVSGHGEFNWLTSSGGFAGTVAGSNTPVALTAGTWTRFRHTGTSPSNAASMSTGFRVTTSSVGDQIFFCTVMVAAGDVAAFVPSLRIVGDVDMRAEIAWTDSSPSVDEHLIDIRSGNNGIHLLNDSSASQLFARHGDGTVTRGNTGILLTPMVSGTFHKIRTEFDISAGEALWYLDDVLQDTNTGLSTNAGLPSGLPLVVGAVQGGAANNVDGKLRDAEVRDGKAGPIVARFDADDFKVGDSDGATAVDVTGRTWTLHGAATRITSGGPVRHTGDNVLYTKLEPAVTNPL